MNIAILGGAFDPPHIGHYLVAAQVKEQLHMDEVWLMPCYSYFPEFPVKYSHITTPKIRFEMAQFFRKYGIQVSDFEFRHNKQSRTVDTMRLLRKYYPKDTFSFIMGSDALPNFHLWDNWKDLLTDERLIIFPRDTDFKTLKTRVKTFFKLQTIPSSITVVEGDLMVSNIASTHIRKRIRQELPIHSMVLPEVAQYIRQYNLYR